MIQANSRSHVHAHTPHNLQKQTQVLEINLRSKEIRKSCAEARQRRRRAEHRPAGGAVDPHARIRVCGCVCEARQPSLSRWLNHDGSDLRSPPPHTTTLPLRMEHHHCFLHSSFCCSLFLTTDSVHTIRREGRFKRRVSKRAEESVDPP